jgi:hypothetical protein
MKCFLLRIVLGSSVLLKFPSNFRPIQEGDLWPFSLVSDTRHSTYSFLMAYFGTRGSEVQILSPRPFVSADSIRQYIAERKVAAVSNKTINLELGILQGCYGEILL